MTTPIIIEEHDWCWTCSIFGFRVYTGDKHGATSTAALLAMGLSQYKPNGGLLVKTREKETAAAPVDTTVSAAASGMSDMQTAAGDGGASRTQEVGGPVTAQSILRAEAGAVRPLPHRDSRRRAGSPQEGAAEETT